MIWSSSERDLEMLGSSGDEDQKDPLNCGLSVVSCSSPRLMVTHPRPTTGMFITRSM
jgi:hypothetical protein